MATVAETAPVNEAAAGRIPKAAYYALAVMMLGNILNFLDRQIFSILAQSIKADLELDDADLGFLLGTAFAVFYSIVGIAMGRISDGLSRKKLMALGLTLWSAMTALGGSAASFAVLALARIGVGVGEAVANPCSHSLVAEVFPKRNRAAVMSALICGAHIGAALAMFIGGYILTSWPQICSSVPIAGACALAPWQAALYAVALPGLPVALMILAIREPPSAPHDAGSTLGLVLREVGSALPPFTLLAVAQVGGATAIRGNLAIILAMMVACTGMILLTGDAAQWVAFGLGCYAVVTWGQIQKYRDRPLFRLTFGDPTFVLATAAFSLITCISGSAHAWAAPYALRSFDLPARDIGLALGLVGIAGAMLGSIVGGQIADRWRARDLRAPMGMAAISIGGTAPCILLMLMAGSFSGFLAAAFFLSLFSGIWGPSGAAMIQDLVLPRMRGSAASSFSLVTVVIASGTGPYWVGKVSTLTGSLSGGLISMLPLVPVVLLLLWLCALRMPGETAETRLARAGG